jgi:hypothetical protein
MEAPPLSALDLGALSRFELVSIYINSGFGEDLALRAALESERAARHLPLPEPLPRPLPPPRGPVPMRSATFADYLLLIYTLTGLFYAWLFLPLRLLRGDFQVDRRHHLIQAGIALTYQAVEILVFFLAAGD